MKFEFTCIDKKKLLLSSTRVNGCKIIRSLAKIGSDKSGTLTKQGRIQDFSGGGGAVLDAVEKDLVFLPPPL